MHFATLGDCANESQASVGWCWRDCSPDHDPEGGHWTLQVGGHKRVDTASAHTPDNQAGFNNNFQ